MMMKIEFLPKFLDLVPLLTYPIRLIQLHDLLAVVNLLVIQLYSLPPDNLARLPFHLYLLLYPSLLLRLHALPPDVLHMTQVRVELLPPFLLPAILPSPLGLPLPLPNLLRPHHRPLSLLPDLPQLLLDLLLLGRPLFLKLLSEQNVQGRLTLSYILRYLDVRVLSVERTQGLLLEVPLLPLVFDLLPNLFSPNLE